MLGGMAQDRHSSDKADNGRGPRQALSASHSGGEELTFTPRGDPDPRLVQLARLLGRQLARETFEAETLAARPHRSR